MFISGTQNFDTDLAMDYIVEVPFKLVRKAAWQAMFKKNPKAAKDLEDLENDEEIQSSDPDKNSTMISINIFGNPDDFDFKIGKGKRKGK